MKLSTMKKLLTSAIVILFFQGCTSKVEIPVNHAGVIKIDGQVNTEVLKPGQHLINFGSEVIVYDVNLAYFNLELDFFFSDTTRGDLQVAIEFKPIADSLSAFYIKYQSIHITPIIEQATGNVIRDLLFKYKHIDLTKNEFEIEIAKAIKANHAIINYVEIREIDIVELRY